MLTPKPTLRSLDEPQRFFGLTWTGWLAIIAAIAVGYLSLTVVHLPWRLVAMVCSAAVVAVWGLNYVSEPGGPVPHVLLVDLLDWWMSPRVYAGGASAPRNRRLCGLLIRQSAHMDVDADVLEELLPRVPDLSVL